jgi:hypothetical protein
LRRGSLQLSAAMAGFVIFANLAAYDLAVEREGLQNDVDALSVLVGEGKTDVEPKVFLALAPDH